MSYEISQYGHYYHLGKERFTGENIGYYYFGHLRRLFWTNQRHTKCFEPEQERILKEEIKNKTLPEKITEIIVIR